MNILLIPLFAILNRLRGANGFTWIGKVGIMAILFYLLWPSWIIGLLAAGFYFLGQSCGWGWWIGYILNQVISPKPIENISNKLFKVLLFFTCSNWSVLVATSNLVF